MKKRRIHVFGVIGYLVLILVMLAVTYFITRYQMEVPVHRFRRSRSVQHLPKIRLQQQAVWFLYVVVTTFSMAVGLLTELYRQRMHRQAVEFEMKKAELALYKAQINPHFLFNNLNTLYGMVVTASDKTEEAFMQFISLMKYMYTNHSKDKIPISTEIEYIRQYIALQKYRITEDSQVHFSYRHDGTEQLDIAPMLLITFVENAFKYGVSSHQDTEISIRLSAKGRTMHFAVSNAIMRDTAKGDGIGIINCRKRLALLYPGAHELKISQTADTFSAELSITEK